MAACSPQFHSFFLYDDFAVFNVNVVYGLRIYDMAQIQQRFFLPQFKIQAANQGQCVFVRLDILSVFAQLFQIKAPQIQFTVVVIHITAKSRLCLYVLGVFGIGKFVGGFDDDFVIFNMNVGMREFDGSDREYGLFHFQRELGLDSSYDGFIWNFDFILIV